MKKQISFRLFFIQWFFLVIMIILGIICYELFFPVYYDLIKNAQINNAYLDIKDLDLANLDDYSIFSDYEEEGLTFVIADEDMEPIYTSRNNSAYTVYTNISMKLSEFSTTPEIIERDSKQKEVTKIRAKLKQDDVNYYIVIKDTVHGSARTKIIEKFLIVIFSIIFGIGSFAMLLLSKHFTAPILNLTNIAEKIVDHNFLERAEENGAYTEINRLAKSLNRISDQLAQSMEQVEESRDWQLRQNVRQERMEKMRKDFIANASHELKTPLAVISSQTEMLALVNKDEQEYYLTSIQEEIDKISSLVSRLLDTTVLEHHMENMLQKTLNMKEVMEYIIMKYDGLAKKKNVHMESFLADDCTVHGDREYIEQAVNNYMMNAFEHTKFRGSIRTTLRRDGMNISVGIYNTGKQIPADEIEHIWTGFYSKSQKNPENLSHAGLGLYIVQSVVTMHNGKYGVENLPEGVEFWFTLPAAE